MLQNINYNQLRSGILVGYTLSKLEFLWNSNYDFTQNSFETCKKELESILSDDIDLDSKDYQSYCNSIIGYYFKNNLASYSSVMIGISFHRFQLFAVTNKEEILELAQSALVSIPKHILSNKDKLIDILIQQSDSSVFELIDVLFESCNNQSFVANDDSIIPTLFLSYSSNDSGIADIIETQINFETNNGIKISRYSTEVKYKYSFKEFMNSIEKHDYVLCIVSENYLKSKACMYEVGEVIKNHDYKDKLLFVVLNDADNQYLYDGANSICAANIYGDGENRIKYIKYWQEKFENLKKEIDEIVDDEAKYKVLVDLKEVGKIYRNDIGEFLDFLSDNNGKSFEQLYNNNFLDIIEWIIPNWKTQIFANTSSYSELLIKALEEIYKTTKTDYNQIALKAKTSSHQIGLIVFADNISEHKQKYRLVVVDGLMSKAFSTGSILNIKNVNEDKNYFSAVLETESELIVPIKINGNTIGVINSESEKNNYYSDKMVQRLDFIAKSFAVGLNRLGYYSNISSSKIPYVHAEF